MYLEAIHWNEPITTSNPLGSTINDNVKSALVPILPKGTLPLQANSVPLAHVNTRAPLTVINPTPTSNSHTIMVIDYHQVHVLNRGSNNS